MNQDQVSSSEGSQQISPLQKVNGAKFVVVFIVTAAVVGALFCYAIYESYMTRPKIKIEEEVGK